MGDAAGHVYIQRTSNGGGTRTAPLLLAMGITYPPAAAAYGVRIDVAYVKRVPNTDGSFSTRLYYKRSVNGGSIWTSRRVHLCP